MRMVIVKISRITFAIGSADLANWATQMQDEVGPLTDMLVSSDAALTMKWIPSRALVRGAAILMGGATPIGAESACAYCSCLNERTKQRSRPGNGKRPRRPNSRQHLSQCLVKRPVASACALVWSASCRQTRWMTGTKFYALEMRLSLADYFPSCHGSEDTCEGV